MTNPDRPGRDHHGHVHHVDPQKKLPLLSGGLLSRRVLGRTMVVLAALLIALVLILLTGRGTSELLNTQARPTPLFVIVGPGKGDAPLLIRPLAAAWSTSGQIFISDTGNQRICVFSDQGRFVREFGRTKRGDGTGYDYTLQQPAGLVVRDDGRVYVADVRGGCVAVFDAHGALLKRVTYGSTVGGSGWTPTDVALVGDRLYVTDSRGVAIFSGDGAFIRRIDRSQPGTPFSHPNGTAVRKDGSIIIADTNNGRIVAMKTDGSRLWSTGPDVGKKRVVGLPRGVCVAANGDVIFADAFLFGVVRLSPSGAYLDSYGTRGGGLGEFSFPNDVDARGELLVVTDKENNRIQVVKYPGLLKASANQ